MGIGGYTTFTAGIGTTSRVEAEHNHYKHMLKLDPRDRISAVFNKFNERSQMQREDHEREKRLDIRHGRYPYDKAELHWQLMLAEGCDFLNMWAITQIRDEMTESLAISRLHHGTGQAVGLPADGIMGWECPGRNDAEHALGEGGVRPWLVTMAGEGQQAMTRRRCSNANERSRTNPLATMAAWTMNGTVHARFYMIFPFYRRPWL